MQKMDIVSAQCEEFKTVLTGLVSIPSDESWYIFIVYNDVFVWSAT